MKRVYSLALLAALCLFELNLMALPGRFQQDQSGSAQREQQQKDVAQSPRSFEGKIMNAGGRYVLQDASAQKAYFLDDQGTAKQYAGKDVKVVATIDPDTNTLHILEITPLDDGK